MTGASISKIDTTLPVPQNNKIKIRCRGEFDREICILLVLFSLQPESSLVNKGNLQKKQ